MNPLYVQTPAQRSAVREQYLSSLQLQIENDQKNLNANKILKYTGEVPTQISDTRTTEEKFADMISTRRDVKDFIVASGYLTPSNANIFVDSANDGIIQFIYRNKQFILRDYLSKGVTPRMFNDFIEGYVAKYNRNAGIEMGIQGGYIGQAPVISNNQLLNRLIRQVDLDTLEASIDKFAEDNRASILPVGRDRIRSIIGSIERLRPRIITDVQLREIDNLSPADQERIRSLLSEMYKDLPAREQLIVKQNELNDAIQRGNLDRAFGVMRQINDLIDIGEGRAEEIDDIFAAAAEEATFEEASPLPAVAVDAETLERLNEYYNEVNLKETVGKQRQRLDKFLVDTGLRNGLKMTSLPNYGNYEVGEDVGVNQYRRLFFKDLKEHTNWEQLADLYIMEREALGEDIIGKRYNSRTNTFRDDDDIVRADVEVLPRISLEGDDATIDFRDMTGRGAVKSRKEKFKKKVEFVGEKPKPYVSFGKYYLNRQKLNDDILQIKGEGGANANFKSRRISPTLKAVFQSLLENKTPDFSLISKLSNTDKETLYEAVKTTKYDKISIDAPSKSEDEKLANEFDVLRGSILGGNDNPQTIKRFKLLLVKLMNSRRIPRGEANDILFELAQLGF
jgi:hypothetical protein